MTRWIATMILKCNDLKSRVKLIVKFIKIARVKI